jgi:ssDNA-binding Zn-finger/Zn-ribbon topoisomerase 1
MKDEDVVKCPECGGETDHETVHNGVALLHGPNYCTECEWTEWSDAGKVVD